MKLIFGVIISLSAIAVLSDFVDSTAFPTRKWQKSNEGEEPDSSSEILEEKPSPSEMIEIGEELMEQGELLEKLKPTTPSSPQKSDKSGRPKNASTNGSTSNPSKGPNRPNRPNRPLTKRFPPPKRRPIGSLGRKGGHRGMKF